jgi:phage-related protein
LKALGPVIGQLGGVFGTIGKDLGGLFSTLAPAIKAGTQVFGVLIDVIAGILPVFGKIAAALANALAPAFVALAGIVKSLLPDLTPLVSIFASFAGAVLTDLSGVLGAVAKLFQGLAPTFKTLAQVAGQVFTVLENSNVFAILGDALERLAPALAQLVNTFVKDLAPILPMIVQLIGQLAGVAVTTLTNSLLQLMPVFLNLINKVLVPLVPSLVALTPLLADLVTLLGIGLVGAVKLVTPVLMLLTDGIGLVIKGVSDIDVAFAGAVGSIVGSWGDIKSKTMSILDSIAGFIKAWWPELLGVFTFGIGTVVGLVIQNWGKIKSTTASVFNSIKGTASDIWGGIAGVITGAISGAVGKVHVTIGAFTSWLSTAWGNIVSGVTSFATNIKNGVMAGIVGGINAVIGFLNDIIGVLKSVPFLGDKLHKIATISTSTSGSANQAPTSDLVPGHYQGGLVTQPMYRVGEEAPQHPEIVLASNPAYRQRNLGLWQQAGSMLGVPGFATGGIPGFAEGGGVAKEVGEYFMSKGADRVAAAAVMGNSYQESGWNTDSQDGPGNYPGDPGGAGLAGWTPGSKIPGYGSYPMPPGQWSDVATQAQLYWYGNAAAGSPGIASLMPTMGKMSLDDATSYFFDNWEHGNPAYENLANREHGSQMAFDLLGGKGGGGGILGTIGNIAGSIGSTIAGVPGDVLGLLSDGAKLLISKLPNPSKLLPSWLQGLGGSLIGDATGWIKSKASSLLNDINPFGGGGSNAGVSGKGLPTGVSIPAAGWDPLHDPVDNWIIPILNWAAGHGWAGSITSGYRPPGEVVSNPQGLVAPQGHSNHNLPNYPGGAIDVGDPGDKTDGQALWNILQNYPGSPNLVWGGPTIGDWGHFSATGHARGGIIPGYAQGGIFGDVMALAKGTAASRASAAKKTAATKATLSATGLGSAGSSASTANLLGAAGLLGSGGPLPFDSSDLGGLNSMLGGIFALDGGSTGIGVGPDGDTARLSALISTNTGNWSNDTLFPPPNFGSISDPTQFVVIPPALADGTQPPAYLSSNITGVSSKLGQVIGWETSWVGDLQQAAALSRRMAKPIETAIKRRVAQVAKIKARVQANLKKIKSLNDQITTNGSALKGLANATPPFANPKNEAERKKNKYWLAQQASMKSQIASRITGLTKQLAPLEAENMALTGSKTAGGTTGELAAIQAQLGVPSSSASSLSLAEGGGGTSASGLYGLQGSVAGWLSPITGPGGDLPTQQTALAIYQKQLANLGPGALAAVAAANSSSTALAGSTTAGATSTTGGESAADQVKDQMIEALGLRARSAEALLKAEVPIPGFATGGIPFGGWYGGGGDITASQPTLIGVGDGGTENVSIRKAGQPTQADTLVINFPHGTEWLADQMTVHAESRERGQVRQAIRRLPGAGGGHQVRISR